MLHELFSAKLLEFANALNGTDGLVTAKLASYSDFGANRHCLSRTLLKQTALNIRYLDEHYNLEGHLRDRRSLLSQVVRFSSQKDDVWRCTLSPELENLI